MARIPLVINVNVFDLKEVKALIEMLAKYESELPEAVKESFRELVNSRKAEE